MRRKQQDHARPPSCPQGSLRAYIPANNKTTPGPKFMERGDIGWAGGSSGPDWFIYLGAQVACRGGEGGEEGTPVHLPGGAGSPQGGGGRLF